MHQIQICLLWYLSMAWKTNYQESQWFIPSASDRTLLCNCWGSFPREGLLAIFAAWLLKLVARPNLWAHVGVPGGWPWPGFSLLASSLWEQLPSCHGHFWRALLSQLERQTLCCFLVEIISWSLPPLELYKSNSELFEWSLPGIYRSFDQSSVFM